MYEKHFAIIFLVFCKFLPSFILFFTFQIEVVKERQPTQLHHPKYDVNSLLNCPHDLSHAGEMIEHTRTSTALLGKLTQPTQLHHPKYDVDSLLNCPHDLSHAGKMIAHTRNSTALLGRLKQPTEPTQL